MKCIFAPKCKQSSLGLNGRKVIRFVDIFLHWTCFFIHPYCKNLHSEHFTNVWVIFSLTFSIWVCYSRHVWTCRNNILIYQYFEVDMYDPITWTRGTELPSPLFPLFIKHSVYISIFNNISLLFHLFVLILTSLCPYPYNFMFTATYMCRPYI